MLTTRFIAITGVLCLTALAAGAQTPPVRTVEVNPLVLTLRTDKDTYHPKDAVKLTLNVKNASRAAVKVVWNSGMKYDFEIRKGKTPSGEKLWQWSQGRMFMQLVTAFTLEPGKEINYNETYNPGEKGPNGKLLPVLEPGTYTATGILAQSGRAPQPMSKVTFVVK